MFRGLDTRRGGRFALGLVGALCLASGAPSGARAEPSLEYAIKAAYLYKLAAFVDWPPTSFQSANSPLHVCVVGDDPFKSALDQTVAGQSIGGRPVQVARYSVAEPGMDCQVAFVAGSAAQSRADALRALKGQPILTVTDQGRDPTEQGVVGFVLKDNRVRFEIDQRAALFDRLSLSGKLLSLALDVRR